MTKPPRSKKGVRVEENLVDRLSETARAALDAQLFAWPADPVPLGQIADVVARGMATAREILRLYPWPHQCRERTDSWPWQTEKHDGGGWRPIDPDWEPEPSAEYPNCWPDLDPAPFLPDLRKDAFDLLYWLAALREADGAGRAAVPPWRLGARRRPWRA